MTKPAAALASYCMRFLYVGEDSLTDRSCRLQLMVFNFAIYLALGTTLIVSALLIISQQLTLLFKLSLPALIAFLGILYMSRRRWFLSARVVFLVICLVTLCYGIVLYGKQSRLPLFCLNMSLFPFLLFRPREWRWIAVFSGLGFLLFQGFELEIIRTGIQPLSPVIEPWVRFIFTLGAFAGVVTPSVLLFWQSNDHFRKTLKRSRVLALDEKLAAIGRLAAGAAHEINNPLAIIRLTLENLDGLTETASHPSVKFRIRKGYDAIQRIQTILQKLLMSTTAAQGQPEPLGVLAISQLLSQRSARFLQSRGIELTVKMELAREGTILCHRQHVIDAFDSLINNALEAMRGQQTPAVSLTLKSEERFFCVQVEDCGPGVSERIIRSIFTPFFTTKEVGSGMGLSLYSARCIARQYGGDLTCESGPGGRFYLSLPLAH